MNTHTLEPGIYTIQQKSSVRFVDAQVNRNDFALYTRALQDFGAREHEFFNGPGWILTLERDGSYTIQQKSTGRFVDAHEIGGDKDFAVVTRPRQTFDETQNWILTPLGSGVFTIQQKSSRRFLDAYQDAQHGWAVVTRLAQNDDTQRWILREFIVEG